MRDGSHRHAGRLPALALAIALAALLVFTARVGMAQAPAPSIDTLLSAVVHIKTFINPEGRTVETLGREREASGIVIDASGLVLTIGYAMVEAYAAEVRTREGRVVPANIVGYDHDTGFGLLRTLEPVKVAPMAIGQSAALKTGDPVIAASAGGPAMAMGAQVVARREFAGTWEYLLADAIFTSPPHPRWSGAALVNRDGKLTGVGSLVVADAKGSGETNPGNMFVPVDVLASILADLIADGKAASAPDRPWIGLNTQEQNGQLVVVRAVPGGPAQQAGVARGAVIAGVDGEKPRSLADFYRKVWARGRAGVSVPLDVIQDGSTRRIEIKSMNRLDHLKLKTTF